MTNYFVQAADDASFDVISLAFEAVIDAGQWPEVMVGLKELINCQTALIVCYDFQQISGSIRYAA